MMRWAAVARLGGAMEWSSVVVGGAFGLGGGGGGSDRECEMPHNLVEATIWATS
jgi:hypothetical protein